MSPYSRMVSLTAFEFFPFYLILCGYGRETAFIEMYPGKKQSWSKPVWFCHAATSQAKARKSPGARRLPENTGADILVFRQNQVKATILYDSNNWAHMLSEGCVKLNCIPFFFFFSSFISNPDVSKAWEKGQLSALHGSKFQQNVLWAAARWSSRVPPASLPASVCAVRRPKQSYK